MKPTKPKSKLSMPLAELLETYIASRPGLRPTSVASYRWTLRSLEKYLKRPAMLADFKEETVTGFVIARMKTCSAHTALRDRNSLAVWWRFAARKKLVKPPPIEGIMKVKVARKNATAWTLKELEQLLSASGKLQGLMMAEGDRFRGRHCWPSGLARSKWWSSLFLFLYDTGARISSALAVTPADIDLDRGLVVLRSDTSKVGLEQVLRLSQQTVGAIREHFDPQAKRVWYYGWHTRQIWEHLKEILRDAGLPFDRNRKFHCFRRTCATLTAAAGRLDLAQSTLGHTTGYMTRNYIDQQAAPSQSAADVLPRPVFGKGNGQASHETPQTPAEKPNGDSLAILGALSPEQLQALLKLAKALS